MQTAGTSHSIFCFGEFSLDADSGVLLKYGTEVKLRHQSFEVLRYLVEHRGRLVTKKELLDAVWGDTVVTGDSLTQCLIDARRAIGDMSRRMIRTVPRRGYIFELPVSERDTLPTAADESPLAGSGRTLQRWAVAAALVLALVVAAAWWAAGDRASEKPAMSAGVLPQTHPNSIAVLPFVNMSPQRDQEYLSDGIPEEILNLLSTASDLQVVARTSSFSFKGQNADIASIAAKLNVAYVLQGSVRRSGDRIRITTQLVDASTSEQRWSQAYDRELGDVIDLQIDIATAVADALKVALMSGAVPERAEPESAEAHALFLQARYFFSRRGPGDLDRARGLYRQALESNPRNARAWAGLAGTYHVQGDERPWSQTDLARWREAVGHALEYGSGLAEVQMRAAQYYWHSGEYEASHEHRRRAAKLEPNHPLVLGVTAGVEAAYGRLDKAIDLQRQAINRDPLGFPGRLNLAVFLTGARRLDEAQAEYQKLLELNPAMAALVEVETAFILIVQNRFEDALSAIRQWPDGPERETGLALVYDGLGRKAESDVALMQLTARAGTETARRAAEVYAQRGQIDEAFRWLEKGRDEARAGTGSLIDFIWLTNVRVSPFLAPLHHDRRWEELMDAARQL
jgi:TolB-like protein/DNA-binding winged helix-turn-helix (wHTH) protein/cytochrome c-type biogenesis protein CcmH/NrfG